MDFANESYVRLYTRDTMTWKRFNWQAKAVLPLLFRKLDRSGVLELAGLEPAEAVALAIELPLEVVAEAMPVLLKLHVVEVNGDVLVEPNFIEAQECTKSDALRAKEYRERRRSQAMAGPSQNVTRESQGVTQPSREITERHAASQSVTLCSAVLPSALHPSAEREIARADSDEWKTGRDWFIASFLGGDDTQAPDLIKWRDDYAALGRKPKAEREAVARVAGADTWVIANRGGSANPGHFVKHWGRYKTGGTKTVARGPSGSEQEQAAREASVASRAKAASDDFNARIRKARAEGDDYTANRLAAERDQLVAHIQAKAS